ncbi:ABC transporter permease, partial [Enterobacter hormaechei]|uniref:ABC transporter permease n=1 Tax=Enterobacter hormaechei TaxID=158836 RepID=UPI00203C1633
QPMLWQSLPLPAEGWNLHLLHDASAATAAGRAAALTGGAAWLALGFLGVCLVNTVGLLLAKFLRRSGEIGVRRALGASRG